MKITNLMVAFFLSLCIHLLFVPSAHADESKTSNSQTEQQSSEAAQPTKTIEKMAAPKTGQSTSVGWLTSLELWLSLSVLCFGLITMAVEIVVIKSGSFKPDDSIKLLAVTLIVISTLFIITAGFDSEQIAPAMGLFGTVAGYMLGKVTPDKEE